MIKVGELVKPEDTAKYTLTMQDVEEAFDNVKRELEKWSIKYSQSLIDMIYSHLCHKADYLPNTQPLYCGECGSRDLENTEMGLYCRKCGQGSTHKEMHDIPDED